MRPCSQRRWPLHRRADALVLDVLARLRALEDRAQERRDVGRHHLERRLAVDLVLRLAHRVRERLVDERVLAGCGRGTRSGPGMLSANRRSCDFLRLQRVADADVVLDVVHHGERAADAAAHLAIGEQRDAHPAQLARRAGARAARTSPSRRRRRARCSPAFRRTRRPAASPSARGRAGRRRARRSSRRTACWRSGCLSWRSKYRIGRPTLSVTRRSRCSRWPASSSSRFR